ncbi:hypothetical protein Zm00014a_008954 [Zea mays]|nr:hypothetical protein Zm00014a_008954 [Zea mays]
MSPPSPASIGTSLVLQDLVPLWLPCGGGFDWAPNRFLESGRSMAQRGELGRQLPLRGPLKALEADIHHANAMADAIQRNYGGSCVQMRLSFSSLAPLFLYFIQWLDCGCCYALPSYLGLFHILICKVYADGDSSVSTYERRASLREFYGDW